MDKQELEKLRVSVYEKLRGAIGEGDKEKALRLLDEIDRNRNTYRDGYLIWVDLLLTYIGDKLGEEAVYETNRIFIQRFLRPLLEGTFGQIAADDRLRNRAYVWSSIHGINIDEIQEDEEKFIIKFKCPTGGAVRTKEQFGKTKEAHAWSYGQKEFCYYCTHCPTFDIMTIEQLGYPAYVKLPQPEGRCVEYLYKSPDSVPEEYYNRVGMKKEMGK